MILPLEKQICLLESAKRLKELNCPQESLFYWNQDWNKFSISDICLLYSDGCSESYSAYTTSELGELLPKPYKTEKHANGKWYCNDGSEVFFNNIETEAEARAKMLIYLAENGLIERRGKWEK